MKQWKYYNSSIYSLRVRKQVVPDRFIKIGLQLYQVDQKSYLLDFRSFEMNKGITKVFFCTAKLKNNMKCILDDWNEDKISKETSVNHNQMMEFFEICANLIGSLAR